MNVISHSTQQISSIPILQVDGTKTILQQDLHSLQHIISTGSDPGYRWDIKANAEGIAIDTSAFTIADLLKGMRHSAQVLGIDESLFMEAMNQAQMDPALRWRTQDEGIVKRFLNVYSETQDDMDNTHPSVTENDSSNYVMICLHNFFNCFYPWAPCFHKPTFMAKLANPAEHTLSFRLLILAICAYNASHALGFHEGEYPLAGVNEYIRSGQPFYVMAREILADICLDDGIDVWTIVALHYLSIYCLDKSKSRSLHYHSLATRMAMQRGYNMSQRESEDSIELEIGRRLWWTLMLFSDILDWTGYTDGDLVSGYPFLVNVFQQEDTKRNGHETEWSSGNSNCATKATSW
jgi:Fungal specific transcription factor domain